MDGESQSLLTFACIRFVAQIVYKKLGIHNQLPYILHEASKLNGHLFYILLISA